MTDKEYAELKEKYNKETERRRNIQKIEDDINTLKEHLDRIQGTRKDCFSSLDNPFLQYKLAFTYDGRTGTYSDEFRIPLTYDLLMNVLKKILIEKQEEYNQAIKEE